MCKVCACVWFLAFIRFSPYCLHDHIHARRWYIVLPTLNVNASAQCANQSRAAGWRGFFTLWCLLLLSRLKNKSHFKVRWKQTRARLRTFALFYWISNYVYNIWFAVRRPFSSELEVLLTVWACGGWKLYCEAVVVFWFLHHGFISTESNF